VPEPSDVEKCTNIDFEAMGVEVERLGGELKNVQKLTEKVMQTSTEDKREPFATKVS
jgi:hypothetical protein